MNCCFQSTINDSIVYGSAFIETMRKTDKIILIMVMAICSGWKKNSVSALAITFVFMKLLVFEN